LNSTLSNSSNLSSNFSSFSMMTESFKSPILLR
jgi:hypothetical protein